MKKRIFSLSILLFPLHLYAAAPSNGNPTTFVGPTAGFGLVQALSYTSAYAIKADVGTNNIRLDGTLGFLIDDNQRLKLSAEYLTQNITYGFASGDTSQWRPQGAIAADYSYALGKYMFLYDPALSVGVYGSHAPSKSLRRNLGTFTNSSGNTVNYTDSTRIAGGNAFGVAPGLYLHPWAGAKTGFDVNYDQVTYSNTYLPSNNPRGFGGTAHYSQMLSDMVNLDFAAGIRQPFNLFQAGVSWQKLPFYGLWAIGFNGEYTAGKKRLPSTYCFGISFDYFISHETYKSYSASDDAYTFLQDTSHSAARMPQTFAVRDELFTHS